MYSATVLKTAGDYLLNLLRSEGPVRYSRFYDGTYEKALAFRVAMGWPKREEEELEIAREEGEVLEHEYDLHDTAETAMDCAVGVLERAGLVATRDLEDYLADGDHDYEVRLTDEGQAYVAGGKTFIYPNVDL